MLHRLALLLEPCQNTPKHFEHDQIKIKIFGLEDEATKPLKRERAKTINCHHPHVLWKFKMSFLVKLSHKIFPLFNRFSTFDKNVNLSKTNPEAKKFLSCFPLAKYLDFYDVSKNSEHINTFRGVRLKKSPFQIQKLNFLKQKESQRLKRKSFHTFSIMANEIFYPKKSQGKR